MNVNDLLAIPLANGPERTALATATSGDTEAAAREESWSYRRLDAAVRSLAAGLAARGLRKGDRVAFFLGNGAELVIASHVSVRGASDSNDAAPLLRSVWDGLEERFRADGVFVSREKLWRIENDGSPASQKVVRELLGWR